MSADLRAAQDSLQSRWIANEHMPSLNGWQNLAYDAIEALRAALAEPPATGLDVALFAVGGLTFRLDAMRGAAKAVLAYGAEPPEYPGLVLVPKADLDLLRKVTEAPK